MKNWNEMVYRWILNRIRKADMVQVDEILDTAISRRRELFPEWDMIYLASPKKDPQERKRILEWVLSLEEKTGRK